MKVNHFIEDKLLVFEITEELDHHAAEIIRKRADYEIQRFMPKKVIFDFKRVGFMDSAGIGLIMGRYKKLNLLVNQPMKLLPELLLLHLHHNWILL